MHNSIGSIKECKILRMKEFIYIPSIMSIEPLTFRRKLIYLFP